MRQAIITRFHGPTNKKGSRYSATAQWGRIYVSAYHALSAEDNHKVACITLRRKIAGLNALKYGRPVESDPWMRHMVCGQLPSGDYAHVFAE